MFPAGFRDRAQWLTDIDVARTARRIGTGEDELRAVIAVETVGGGFDAQGRSGCCSSRMRSGARPALKNGLTGKAALDLVAIYGRQS